MIKNIGQISRDTLPLNSSRTTQIRMLRMLTILIYVANIIFSVAGMAIQSTHSRTSHLHFRYSKYMVLIRHIFKTSWDMVGNS